jgi:acetylornithine deacetylase/succinyl-diaminopimelate desuccinylase-like protein
VHQSGRQSVYFGARGVTGLEVTVYGASRELHSGHYGGWAPNPAVMLAHLLASLRGEDGSVRITGFYDRVEPLSAAEKQAIAETPSVETALRNELGLSRTEGGSRKLEEIINQPTLNVRGIRSADTGKQSRNVVPSSATASLDVRLVVGLSPRHALDLITAHIRGQGYYVTESEPDSAMRKQHAKIARVTRSGGYPAAKTPMDLPIAREVVSAIEKVRGPVVRMPTLGGSVPLYIFAEELKVPFIGVPIANHDNNQHAANENIRLENLWAGIDVMAALMTMH